MNGQSYGNIALRLVIYAGQNLENVCYDGVTEESRSRKLSEDAKENVVVMEGIQNEWFGPARSADYVDGSCMNRLLPKAAMPLILSCVKFGENLDLDMYFSGECGCVPIP